MHAVHGSPGECLQKLIGIVSTHWGGGPVESAWPSGRKGYIGVDSRRGGCPHPSFKGPEKMLFLYLEDFNIFETTPLLFFLFSFFLFFFFFCFLGPHPRYMEVPRLGIELEPQQWGIWVVSATYTTTHGNTGSPAHWSKPGMEPTSSWILVGFVSAVPQWELMKHHF